GDHLVFELDDALVGAEGDRGDGDLGRGGGLGGLADAAPGGAVAVGQQQDVGGREFARTVVGDLLDGLERGEDGVAGGGGLGHRQPSDGGGQLGPVLGGRHDDRGVAGEGDQADVVLLGQVLDEVDGGGLG